MEFTVLELENEIWKDTKLYHGYLISNMGRIKGKERIILYKDGRKYLRVSALKKRSVADNGYYHSMLRLNNKNHYVAIHKLVAMAFLGYTPTKNMTIDHHDNNPLNNRVDNLKIITHRKNSSKDKKNKTSSFTGVRKRSNRYYLYESHISINNTIIHLGCFNCEIEASKSYNTAVENIHEFNGNRKQFRNLIKSLL